MVNAPAKSEKSDHEAEKNSRQGGKRNVPFAERLSVALDGREKAAIARNIGAGKSSIGDWEKGRMPAGDMLVKLAHELGVEARWLALGEGPQRPFEYDHVDDNALTLPLYDLLQFSEYGKPEPAESIPVRREMLGRWATASGIWLARLPTAIDVAEEGELVLCRDPEPQIVDGRFYAALLDGRLVVRRVQVRPEGIVLKTGAADPDPVVLPPNLVEQFQPVARILAAITPQPV